MALNIKNGEVERLASEVARLAHENKTEAIRRALAERKQRLLVRGNSSKKDRVEAFLREQVWPQIPKELLHRGISKKEREKILGYGAEGF